VTVKKKTTKTLKIDSCLKCPNMKVVPDPGEDSFDAGDDAMLCMAKKAKPGKDFYVGGSGYRASWENMPIVGSSRSAKREYERYGSEIPKWCPL
jgi:hypothetical protein